MDSVKTIKENTVHVVKDPTASSHEADRPVWSLLGVRARCPCHRMYQTQCEGDSSKSHRRRMRRLFKICPFKISTALHTAVMSIIIFSNFHTTLVMILKQKRSIAIKSCVCVCVCLAARTIT